MSTREPKDKLLLDLNNPTFLANLFGLKTSTASRIGHPKQDSPVD